MDSETVCKYYLFAFNYPSMIIREDMHTNSLIKATYHFIKLSKQYDCVDMQKRQL